MKTKTPEIHWLPRIFCILAILFVSMVALDSFEPGTPFWSQIAAFLIHLIPTYVLIIFLWVAWKWEFIGGIAFIVIGSGLSPFVFMMNYHRTGSWWDALIVILLITIPFIFIGVLFLVSHYLKKERKPLIH
jgi:hypothetical protein